MASWHDDDCYEDEEREHAPMSDKEHLRTFGWAWDDPDSVEAAA